MKKLFAALVTLGAIIGISSCSKEGRKLTQRNQLIEKMVADRDVLETMYFPTGAFFTATAFDEGKITEATKKVWERYNLAQYGEDGSREILNKVVAIVTPKTLSLQQQIDRWRKFKAMQNETAIN